MKKIELSVIQRILAVLIYLSFFLLGCFYFSHGWDFLSNSTSKYNLLFISGALLLIFGSYIAEPFFTKPVDVITNSIAILLALLSIQDTSKFIGYHYLFLSACFLLVLSIIVIFLSYFQKIHIFQKSLFEILTKLGQSKIVFSCVYLLTVFSYFNNSKIEFTFFITFWVILVTQFCVESFILWFSKILNFIFFHKKYSAVIGQAIGCENPYLYKIEVDFLKHDAREVKKGSLVYLSLEKGIVVIGIIIDERQLLNKKWITVYLLEHSNSPLKINLKTKVYIPGSNNIFSKDNALYALNFEDIEDLDTKKIIRDNYLYKNRANFIGYVIEGSNINKIRFLSLIDSDNVKYQSVKEGGVIKVKIYNKETLFQIIDGKTDEQELERHSSYGYLIGIAQKLGQYNLANQELETVKWLPNIYAPVFLDETECTGENPLTIGKLPMTKLDITLKDIDSLVTHNTAILGILGIGKSCLTFELIQKCVNFTEAKIICIDITNEYKRELIKYIPLNSLKSEIDAPILEDLKKKNRIGNSDDPTSWGNEELYKSIVDEELKAFSSSQSLKVLILNPDWHPVSKAGSLYKIQHKTELTTAEKTRIITERVFIHAKKMWDILTAEERNANKARFLVVFEEAHSLIPEWNSIANIGDQSASNGTAKVILQGRKYGLGSFVVTQRTANISKSILNQCNTIFALRVFDDTGKQFLENYIGSDYSNTLPTLEEKHAIVVGKALKLKQPVIIELNNRDGLYID